MIYLVSRETAWKLPRYLRAQLRLEDFAGKSHQRRRFARLRTFRGLPGLNRRAGGVPSAVILSMWIPSSR